MTEPAFPDALAALSRLHWYVLERVLGQGGFGITYLAKDTNLDQRVAIKEYLPVDVATRMPDTTVRARTEDLRDRYRWGLERFIQEARTLARFDHPNIVRVLSVFEFNSTAYMVMRFEEGGTLSSLLDRRGMLPEADLLRVLLPILDGLELVHGAGFIHRDIKPDNIHIRGDGRPVLLDFGSARQSLGSSTTLTILIAPGYAPFEQYYSDPSSQGPWTDIYALGATCYRVICGRAPMDAVSRSKGVLGSTQEVMVPASVVGAGRYTGRLLAAIDHALAFAERDRPQTIAEWRRELVEEDGTSIPIAPVATQTARGPAASPPSLAPTAPAVTVPAASTQRAKPGPAVEPPPPSRAEPSGRAGAGGSWKWALVAAAIAAVAVALYVVTTTRGDETQSKIAALEKQLKDNDAAEAERDRQAKNLADEQARQRKAQEQARADEEKARAEAARKPEQAPRPAPNAPKLRDASAAKPPAARESAAITATGTARPSPPAKEAVAEPAALATVAPASAAAPPPAALEAPRPAQRAPGELVADADRALAAQRYADAIAILKPLAENGNAQAQVKLADAYSEGQGVDRDLKLAATWYEKAALQGSAGAMLKLGAMYASGNGVAQNNNLAYVWYGAAARLGSNAAKSERDRISSLLQPAEREQADKLIESTISRTVKKP
jgi:serine/threonine protein kinase/TPR repeat protein